MSAPPAASLAVPVPTKSTGNKFRRYRLPEFDTMWQDLEDEYQRSRQVRARKFNPAGGPPPTISPQDGKAQAAP